MTRNFFLLFFILGFHIQFSFATLSNFKDLKNNKSAYLKFLDLSSTKVESINIEELSKLKALTYLDLSNCEKIDTSFFEKLSQCKNIVKKLQILNISDNPQIEFHSDLIVSLSKFRNLQQLILNKNRQISLDFIQELEKVMPKLIVICDQLIDCNRLTDWPTELSYSGNINHFSALWNFIPTIIILYLNSGSQHLLENYLSPLHAKIGSNFLKTLYVLTLYHFIMQNGGPQSLSMKKIILLHALNAFVLFLEIKYPQSF